MNKFANLWIPFSWHLSAAAEEHTADYQDIKKKVVTNQIKYVRLLYLNPELKVVRVFSWYNIVIQKENIQRCLLSILTQWNRKVLFDVQYYQVPRNKGNVLRIKWRWLLTLRELIDCVWLCALLPPQISHDEIALTIIYYAFSLIISSQSPPFLFW